MGMVDAILKRLNRVFNKSPNLTPVISITLGQFPASFSVRDDVFTLTVAGMQGFSIGLDNGLTLQGLADAINVFFGAAIPYDDGSPILYDDGTPFGGELGAAAVILDGSFANFLAVGLYETDQDLSQDINLSYPTSLLYAELKTYALILDQQATKRTAAEKELYAHTADEGWLDFWLDYFDVYRLSGEGDLAFFTRAVAEIFGIRVNNQALAIMLEKALGFQVDVVDLGTATIQMFMSNNVLSVTNGTAASDTLYNNLMERPLASYFGVYLYAGSVDNLTPIQKAAMVNIVEKYKAAGKLAKYFAPTGQMITNTAGSVLNDTHFVVGPTPNGWLEVTV